MSGFLLAGPSLLFLVGLKQAVGKIDEFVGILFAGSFGSKFAPGAVRLGFHGATLTQGKAH